MLAKTQGSQCCKAAMLDGTITGNVWLSPSLVSQLKCVLGLGFGEVVLPHPKDGLFAPSGLELNTAPPHPMPNKYLPCAISAGAP